METTTPDTSQASNLSANFAINDTSQDVQALGKAASSIFDAYTSALSTYSGYIELIAIGISIAVALVAGLMLRWVVNARFKELAESRSWNWLLQPLKLMPALFSLVTLSISKPILLQYVSNSVFYYPATQIVFAILLIQTVHMFIQSQFIAWFLSSIIALMVVLQTFNVLEPIKQLLGNIGFSFGKSDVTVLGIVNGIIICVIVFWLALASTGRIEKQLRNSRMSYNVRELLIKFAKIFIFFVAALITLNAIGVDMTAFAVFGGALGVGIGLGLQKITANFVSGITLLMERSIRQGDLIEVDGVRGYVRALNIRYTLVETFSGQEVSIPNETLTSNNIINSTMSNMRGRIEVMVGVAYGSDYKLVKEILLKAAKEHERTLKDPEPTAYMREFADSSVNFLLQFWVGNVTDGLYGPQSDVMFRIAEMFDEHHITIPFPQRDLNIISVPPINTTES